MFHDPLLQQQAKHLEIGRTGEAWVAAEERQRLAKTPFAGSVEVCSPAQRSSFDIKSRTASGEILYIEVKTTEGEPALPFYMSLEEYSFAEHCMCRGIPYELHRVHHISDDTLRGKLVYSAEEVICLFSNTPASFVLRPVDSPACEAEHAIHCSPEYLPWEDCAERIPGTRCRFYLAKIEGPHAEYRFDRRFQRGKYEYQADKIWLSCDIESTGVYEVSMLWTDEAGNILQRQRDWFLLIDGMAYDLEAQDVLSAVDSLKRLAS